MPRRHPDPHPFRIAFPFFFALILIGLSNIISAELTSAAIPQPYIVDAAGQYSDDRLSSSDVGVATSLLTDDTIVHTPSGTFSGPNAVTRHLATLGHGYPGAQFAVANATTAAGTIVVNWQGTIDGQVVVLGRTTITIEDGAIAEVTFLERPPDSSSEEPPIEVEQQDGISAARVATIEAQGWPNLDPGSLAH